MLKLRCAGGGVHHGILDLKLQKLWTVKMKIMVEL
jgi:hypothetical protein